MTFLSGNESALDMKVNEISFRSAYLELFKTGELTRIFDRARKLLESCCLCPRNCQANRLMGETAPCIPSLQRL